MYSSFKLIVCHGVCIEECLVDVCSLVLFLNENIGNVKRQGWMAEFTGIRISVANINIGVGVLIPDKHRKATAEAGTQQIMFVPTTKTRAIKFNFDFLGPVSASRDVKENFSNTWKSVMN